VPGSWQMVALRHVATVIDCKHRTVPFVDRGVPVASIGEVHGWIIDLSHAKRTTEEEFDAMIEGGREPKAGDVIVSRNATVGAAALVMEGERFCLGQDVSLIRCGGKLLPEFLNWLFRAPIIADQISSASIGATFSRINVEQIKSLFLPLPPLELQRATVNWLSNSVGAVDAVLDAKQRLLDLLAEKRKGIIATAVTCGLDTATCITRTGVEWIPEAPAHWRQSRVGRLFRQSKVLGYPDLTVLSVYREYGVIERSSRDDNANVLPDDLSKYQLVETGDLVVNKMKAWQGSLGISDFRGITSPDYVVFRPTHAELPEYLHFMLRTPQLTTVYLSNSNGIRINQWRIEPERFLAIPVLLPPAYEQKELVEYIARETAKLDAVRAATERTIGLLKERRAALITAAVTGQVDVGAAA
jgi:type I restriction enzyme S subunit